MTTAPATTVGNGREQGGGAFAVPAAIALLAMFIIVGLGVDGVRHAQQIATADAVAEEAARAGGQALDPTALAAGRAELDPTTAAAAAQAYLAASGVAGTVTIPAPGRIHVDVTTHRPTVLLGLIGIDEITATGSAEAELVVAEPGPVGP
ncbi:hypothetical protein [Pseudonocardia sp.]|uniref:hypothetical protein n=1 Tax=Pseudonocardia sp. TaxID=60912 RepID=UPI0025DA25FE|nr:hypothetical protein [Pseudonocardia sp.]